VTFVNPSPHKGLWVFARLADMLGSRRPDIPVLVIQSGHSGGSLTAIPGLDFSRYPQIMAAPPVPAPADYFALTRILVAPSVWEEPFGRVAAEAMINGIPPLVSDRGSLPSVIGGDYRDGGGGRVLPIPEWMTAETMRLPSEQEIEPWYQPSVRWGRRCSLSFGWGSSTGNCRTAIQREGVARHARALLHVVDTRVQSAAGPWLAPPVSTWAIAREVPPRARRKRVVFAGGFQAAHRIVRGGGSNSVIFLTDSASSRSMPRIRLSSRSSCRWSRGTARA
jgi:hypothetical protein